MLPSRRMQNFKLIGAEMVDMTIDGSRYRLFAVHLCVNITFCPLEQIDDFEPIIARSASAVTQKVQL